MNKIIFLLTILCLPLFASNKKIDNSNSQKELDKLFKASENNVKKRYFILAKFIQKTYVIPTKKEIPKLVKEAAKVKNKYRRSQSSKLKQKYKNELKAIENEIELKENWSLYLKAYMIYNKAYLYKDNKKYSEAYKICDAIEKRYSEITGKRFPSVYHQYVQKHGPLK